MDHPQRDAGREPPKPAGNSDVVVDRTTTMSNAVNTISTTMTEPRPKT